MATTDTARVRDALSHWGLQDAEAHRFGTGLINQTFLVTPDSGQQFILQGMNALLQPEVNIDIDALTRHLETRGMVTPRLIATQDGRLWTEQGGCAWRLATFVPGVCHDMLVDEAQAREAGRLLGRFHVGIHDLQLDLRNERLGVHDTQRHLAKLREALVTHKDHQYFDQIEPLAEKILQEAEALPALPKLPDRLVHGDPKISNLVFDEESGAGVCMIDLDTIT